MKSSVTYRANLLRILSVTLGGLLLSDCTFPYPHTRIGSSIGQANIVPNRIPAHTTTASEVLSSPRKKNGLIHFITHPLEEVHLFPPHKAPPPKALALRRIGTIRTLSNDGSYVIVELEPGVLVTSGSELLVTGAAGGPAHLKVSELQPPYFIADIIDGNPTLNQTVQQ